jgi:hypothetical protein
MVRGLVADSKTIPANERHLAFARQSRHRELHRKTGVISIIMIEGRQDLHRSIALGRGRAELDVRFRTYRGEL